MADLKASSTTVLLILALSLATWAFFHLESMPLGPGETAVVAGVWAVLVLGAKRLRAHFRKGRE